MKEKTAHGNATIPELILFVRLYGHFSLGCVKINFFAGRFVHRETSPTYGNNCALHMNNRTERHEEFVVEYVRNGGNTPQAAIFGSSASTVCYRLKNRLMDEIEIE
jgi:hypothetical protein